MSCKSAPISKDLNTHESDLAQWNIVVFTATTTALLFYHMTQQKSITIDRTLAAVISVLIIVASVFYNIYSLYNFFVRTKILILNATLKCEIQRINESRVIYGFITFLVVIVQLLISYHICRNSMKYV
jgi:hypothetical protein